jgi:hypothetical protein
MALIKRAMIVGLEATIFIKNTTKRKRCVIMPRLITLPSQAKYRFRRKNAQQTGEDETRVNASCE